MADDKPIIVIKKKGGHGGHHGGAWKVAYADFVTAMMAFFMVMWLVNSAETKVKKAIASYFRRPGLFESGSGTPLLIGGSGMLPEAFAPPKPDAAGGRSAGKDEVDTGRSARSGSKKEGDSSSSSSQKKTPTKTDQKATGKEGEGGGKAKGILQSEEDLKGVKVEKELQGGAAEIIEKIKVQQRKLEELADAIEGQIQNIPQFQELIGLVDMQVNADGLTIEIMDTDRASMFRSGSAQILPESTVAFEKIAALLKPLPNKIDIMGHTDAKPFSSRGGMSNWELSADRANAARRVLEQQGIPAERITSVVGRADRDLRYPEDPFKASNRRISLKVKFDLAQINNTPEQAEAMKEFNKLLPPGQTMPHQLPAAEASQAAPQEYVTTADGVRVTPTPKPTLASMSYKPQIEIRGKENRDTIPLPPDPDAPARGKDGLPAQNGAPPTIFKNDPVIGPVNPFFGN